MADETVFHFNFQEQCVWTETDRVPILSHRGRHRPSLGGETERESLQKFMQRLRGLGLLRIGYFYSILIYDILMYYISR